MDCLFCGLVQIYHEILINLLGHEGYHRGCGLRYLCKAGIQGHVGVYLVLFHSLSPITLAAEPDIPIRELVHEGLEELCGFSNLVFIQGLIRFLDAGI